MKFVIILGAGASAEGGVPVMRTFLDRANDIMRTTPPADLDRAAFELVFDALAELQGVHARSYLDLDNIESVFGAVEMANLVQRLGSWKPERIEMLRRSLITLIVQTIEHTMRVPRESGGTLQIPSDYHELANAIEGTRHKHSFALLTFNYDPLIDLTLATRAIAFDYCLDPAVEDKRIPLLKLHGSINWARCPECHDVAVFPVHEAARRVAPGSREPTVAFGTQIGRHTHRDLEEMTAGLGLDRGKRSCARVIQGAPLLVPPSWDKASYHASVGAVWKRAARELSQAEHIFIIGYSLPPSDAFFRYLFALGTSGGARLRHIWIYNPDMKTITRRLRSFISRGIRSRVSVQPSRFVEAARDLRNLAYSEPE